MKHLKLVVNNVQNKKIKFFDKKELKKILDLYAQMVSSGLWKDYSLNVSNHEISFNIYERASEFPIYKISKNLKSKNNYEKYFIQDRNGKLINKSDNLNSLIKNLKLQYFKNVRQV